MQRFSLFSWHHCRDAEQRPGMDREVVLVLLLASLCGVYCLTSISVARADPTLAAVNCGGDSLIVLTDGSEYWPDQAFDGVYGALDGEMTQIRRADYWFLHESRPRIEMHLYYSTRVGVSEYRFALPPGGYEITVHWATQLRNGPGIGLTTIRAGDEVLVSDFDAYAEGGKARPIELRGLTHLEGGDLRIEFLDSRGDHDPSAIGIRAADLGDLEPPEEPQGLTALDTYGGVLLRWNEAPQTDRVGYRIYRESGLDWELLDEDRRLPFVVLPTTEEARYAISSFDVYGNESELSISELVGPRSPDLSSLPLYRIEVDSLDLRYLDQNVYGNREVWGDLWIEGELRESVGLSYRGVHQRAAPKKSWNVDLGDHTPVNGHDRLVLKATFVDPTMQRELLMTDLLQQAGLLHSTTFPIRVELNGDYAGVMLDIERIDEAFLLNRGLPENGRLYRVSSTLEPLEDPSLYVLVFEVSNGDDWYRDDVIELSESLANLPEEDILPWLEDHVDLDQYLRLYCHHIWAANTDWIRDDYFLYREPTPQARWLVIPWDVHESFGYGNIGLPIDFGTSRHPDPAGAHNLLLERILAVPSLSRRYGEQLRTFMNEHLRSGAVKNTAMSRTSILMDDLDRDVLKFSREDRGKYISALRKLAGFISARGAEIERQLDAYEPPEHVLVQLAELIPNLSSIDSVEVLNLSDRVFELSGFFLTDDAGNPLKWSVPATSLEPRGRAVLGLSEPIQGGGWIAFFRDLQGPALVDSIRVPAQLPSGRGYGRYPDSSQRWRHLDQPSPGAPNAWTSPIEIVLETETALYEYGQTCRTGFEVTNAEEWEIEGQVRYWVRTREGSSIMPAPVAVFPITVNAGSSVSEQVNLRIPPSRIAAGGYALVADFVFGENDVLASARVELFLVADPVDPWKLNELMAINNQTIADEWGEYDDWLELYNASDRVLTTTNLYLTDDEKEQPWRWPLPLLGLLPREKLIIWCDGEPHQGVFHTNFKLSGGGERIALVKNQGGEAVVRDLYVFGPQQEDVSVGRYPDGNPSWVVLDAPSPGGTNSYSE